MRHRLPSTAAIAAIIGMFGLVQVRAVSIDPPWWIQLLIAMVLLAAMLMALRPSRRKLPPVVERLDRDPSRRRRRPYLITRKRLNVTMEPGSTIRRDARLQWDIEVSNRSRAPLGAITLQLLGDVPVFENDLTVVGRTEGQTVPLEAVVDHRDGMSPAVTITLPAPGLAPTVTMTIAFEYVWPAIAHVHENDWVVDLRNIADGSTIGVTLDSPVPDAQVADVYVYRARLGSLREHVLGHLLPQTAGDRALVELTYTKRRGDELLILDTRPFAPASSRPDADEAAIAQ
jgi:hypothetical protein